MKKDILQPRQTITVNQYVCSSKGCLLTSSGGTRESKMYCGGTLFIDIAINHIKLYHQTSFSAADTICSKQIFKRDCMRHGILSLPTSPTMVSSLLLNLFQNSKNACSKLTGVGSHHQNGIIENAILTVTKQAQAMMLLTPSLHWPEVYDELLWLTITSYAIHLWNHTPRTNTNLSPKKIFSLSIQHSDFLQNTHVWGSPAYVLNPTLQDA